MPRIFKKNAPCKPEPAPSSPENVENHRRNKPLHLFNPWKPTMKFLSGSPVELTHMTLTKAFATETDFRNGWPAAVASLKRLHEERIYLPNYRYELLHDEIAHTSLSLALHDIERCIRQLWSYDKRFKKIDPGSGTSSDFRWAAYTCAYLVRDARIATDLLTIFPPILGGYIAQSLGKLFVQKSCLTFKALVMEQIWPIITAHPDEPSGLFNWHACLNRMSDKERANLLHAAGLSILEHPSVPPIDVMNSFQRKNSTHVNEQSYLQRLSQFYAELGYYHLLPEIKTLRQNREN